MRRLLIAAALSSVSLVTACVSAPTPPVREPPETAAPPAASPLGLFEQGNHEYDAKQYPACAATFDAALSAARDARQTENFAYAAACCHALAGNADLAFARLAQATAAGFRNHAHLEKDPDLTSLRSDARWLALVEEVRAGEARYLASVNAELKALFDADQADRQGNLEWKAVSSRDAQRRVQVEEIVQAGRAKVADDWFHAAMVFQHGMTEQELARAHQFAGQALELQPDHGRAKWLFAASKDRLLMRQEKPQLYGTQFAMVDGWWTLYPVDPSITDEERARYNVPPLAVSRARAEQMNAQGEP